MKRIQVLCFLAACLACIAAAASCGSTGPKFTPPPESGPDVPWKEKTHDQRMAHMKAVVHPAMQAAFARFDADRYAEFDCRSCHGSGAGDGTFRMPNPDLPRLPGGSDGFERLLAEKEEVTKFMVNVVVPGVAGMLGEKPYGPDAPDGFGCFRCHLTKW